MAVTRRFLRGVTPAQVFAVLRDGHRYAEWVVGTRTIRDVDPGWPAIGSRLHYRIGYGPLRHDNVTTSHLYDPDARLQMEASAWPAGTAFIELLTTPAEGGTVVSIDEYPLRGLAKVLHNPVLDRLINVRNVESLRRLEKLARHH
jgi:hypothetical protein